MNKPKNNNEQFNLILFTILSTSLIMGWNFFFPQKNKMQHSSENKTTQNKNIQGNKYKNSLNREINEDGTEKLHFASFEDFLRSNKNNLVKIENAHIEGYINLIGGAIEHIRLKKYQQNIKEKDAISILMPRDHKDANYISGGWFPYKGDVKSIEYFPDNETKWKYDNKVLTPTKPVTLTHKAKNGFLFQIRFQLDEQYMINITYSVTNKSDKTLKIGGSFMSVTSYIDNINKKTESYEGPIGYVDQSFKEFTYKKLLKENVLFKNQHNLWTGITKKYWLTSIHSSEAQFLGIRINPISNSMYRVREVIGKDYDSLTAGQTKVANYNTFFGAKNIKVLEDYSNAKNIPLLSHSIDLGKLYFITKPLLILLNKINIIFHNYGISIIVMTILIRICLIPLATKSYKAMSRMKKLAPKIEELKTIYKNKKELDVATFELYRKEKINPLSGFVPLLFQVPIFFALYRVLYISIDLRHSVFVKNWINDLSAPDPTSFVNLFGLLPFTFNIPSFLQIGILPILMGLTMWLQQRGNVTTLSKDQAKIMKFLPLIFTFLFAKFPSGLVLYWTVTNIFSIIQEKIIKSRTGG